MKRIISTLAAVAMVIVTYIPAKAINKGQISRSRPRAQVEVDNTSNDTTLVTVYYLDNRGLDAVEIVSVPPNELNFIINLPKPVRATKRVIIEVDLGQGSRITVRVNQPGFAATSDDLLEPQFRLVFEVVE